MKKVIKRRKKQDAISSVPTNEDHPSPYFWIGMVALLFGLFFWRHPTPHANPPSLAEIVPSNSSHLRWNEMVNVLNDYVDRYEGDVGIYIKDLKTGESFERNADYIFPSASLIKLPIMVATFQAIKEGHLSLDTNIRLKRSYRRGGSGVLRYVRTGRSLRVGDLLYKMITKSDNTATAMLIDHLGYDYLNKVFSQVGLQTTHIHPEGMSLADYITPTKENYTTAREMGTLLEKIYRREFSNDGTSDLMLQIMKGANSRSRLAKYLPRSWEFARKTGLLRSVCHDVGIVYTNRSDVIVCVLTGHNNNYKRAKGFIASIGRKAYAYLGNS